MKLRQLEILNAIKEQGTISGAANQLFIAQPSLSLAVKELEAELGVTLFTRNNHGVEFTAFGEEACIYIEKILQYIDEILAISSDNETVHNKDLYLSSNFYYGFTLLTDVILALEQEKSHNRSFQFANNAERLSWSMIITNLLNDDIDLAVVKINRFDMEERIEQIKTEHLILQELFEEDVYVAARKSHPLAGKWNDISALREYQYVSEDINNKLNDYIKLEYGEEFCLDSMTHLESRYGLMKYLSNTDAITLLSKEEMEDVYRVYEVELDIIPIKNFNLKRVIGCLRRERDLDWAEQEFTEKLLEMKMKYNFDETIC